MQIVLAGKNKADMFQHQSGDLKPHGKSEVRSKSLDPVNKDNSDSLEVQSTTSIGSKGKKLVFKRERLTKALEPQTVQEPAFITHTDFMPQISH